MLDEERIDAFVVSFPEGFVPGDEAMEAEFAKRTSGVKLAFRLSSLVLDLFIWEQMEPFDAFLSALDEAPPDSSACKLKEVDLVTDEIKWFAIGAKHRVSKSELETRIQENLQFLAAHNNMKTVKRLFDRELNPRLMLALLKKDAENHMRCTYEYHYSKSYSKSYGYTFGFHWRIIQRLPRAKEFLKKKISQISRAKIDKRKNRDMAYLDQSNVLIGKRPRKNV